MQSTFSSLNTNPFLVLFTIWPGPKITRGSYVLEKDEKNLATYSLLILALPMVTLLDNPDPSIAVIFGLQDPSE